MRGLLLLSLVLCAALPLAADEMYEAAKAQELRMTHAIKAALKAYVFVGGGGSGVLISADGFILTNDHVAGGAHKWRVRTSDGVLRHARLVGTDPYGDVALLKIDGAERLPFLRMGDADKLKSGQPVIAIGNPFGLSNVDERPTVTVGVVSALHRFNLSRYSDAIMTDASLNPGNSGGPLVTMDGRLVGINGQIRTRFEVRSNTGIGYAISINQIQNFLPALKAAGGGFVKHGHIPGLVPTRPESLMRPPQVVLVREGSLADKAGFKRGDRLIAIGSKQVLTTNRFYGVMLTYPGGTKIEVTVRRAGKLVIVPVVLKPLRVPGDADLGVSFLKVGASAHKMRVDQVAQNSPAATAGLQVGDRLISMTGVPIGEIPPALLETYMASQFAAFSGTGSLVELTVLRAGKQKQLVLKIPRGNRRIGFTMGKVPKTQAKVNPLTIKLVKEGSMAEKAGLLAGDVLLGINDVQVKQVEEFSKLLQQREPGEVAEVAVRRNGKVKVFRVTLGLKRELP